MDPRPLVRLLGGARVLIGAALVTAPRTAGRLWLRTGSEAPATEVALRGLGVREVALGLGTLAALEAGGAVRRWLEAGALADLGDTTAMVMVGDELAASTRALTIAAATGAAALGVWLSRRVEG